VNEAYTAHFIKSARCVFETMFQMALECGEPVVKAGDGVPHDVSAIIEFGGDAEGVAVLSLPEAIARRLVTLLLGSEVTSQEDLSDGVGEILNIIAGGAKAQFGCEATVMSCPSVVMGAGHAVRGLSNLETTVIPASCDCGRFVIEVSIRATLPVAA